MQNKKIHFIGICGVAMSALAIAMKKAGYIVTGSDAGFFPPVSTNLKNNQIDFYPGWHPDRIGTPDLVVVGNVAGSENSEWLHVQQNKIPYVSYPELIAKFFVKKNSIVCAGTYGKTTSSSLLAWILKENGYNPSYMFGGISLNNIDSATLTDSDWSIMEGDEYKSARWDNRPKFAHYSPTHLLLTGVEWDHADVYPIEQSYFDAFQNLIDSVPNEGTIIINEDIKNSRLKIKNYLTYGQPDKSNYQYYDIIQTKDGTNFNIRYQSSIFYLQSTLAGDYMPKNITGCFAMAHQIGIKPENIIKSVASFKNIKRRLEKRFEEKIIVFDDIAHSPAKAQAVLKSVKKICSGKLIAIFEPNTGNRKIESIPGYNNAFKNADEIIIPRLTQVKINKDDLSPPFDGKKLTEIISKTHNNTKYINDDKELIQYIMNNTNEGDVVIFLGSHGFRGMIDELIKTL